MTYLTRLRRQSILQKHLEAFHAQPRVIRRLALHPPTIHTFVDHVLSVLAFSFPLSTPYLLSQGYFHDLLPLDDILDRLQFPLWRGSFPVSFLGAIVPTPQRTSFQPLNSKIAGQLATRHPLFYLRRDPPPLPLPGCLDHAAVIPTLLHPLDPVVVDRADP